MSVLYSGLTGFLPITKCSAPGLPKAIGAPFDEVKPKPGIVSVCRIAATTADAGGLDWGESTRTAAPTPVFTPQVGLLGLVIATVRPVRHLAPNDGRAGRCSGRERLLSGHTILMAASSMCMEAFTLPDFSTVFGLVLALAGLAIGMVAVPGTGPWEFLIARAFLASAVVLFGVKLSAWGSAEFNAQRLAVVGLIGAGLSIGLVASFHWVAQKEKLSLTTGPSEPAIPERPLSMRDIFDSDFTGMGKYFTEVNIKTADSEWDGVPANLYWDDRSNSIFLSFCLPSKESDLLLASILIRDGEDILNKIRKDIDILTSDPGRSKKTSLSTMAFTRQVYIYREADFTVSELYQLEQIAEGLHLNVSVFGHAYLTLHWQEHGRRILGTRQSRADQAKAALPATSPQKLPQPGSLP